MLQAELKILGGKHQGKLIVLSTKKFLVGREQDCHLRPNSDLVSRHHCVFTTDDYAVRLRDLGSTNGTLVNGASLRGEAILKAGDRVTIGKLELEVLIRQTSGKTPLPPTISPPDVARTGTNTTDALSTAEIATQSDEAETSYEVAALASPALMATAATIPADTAIIGTMQGQYPPGAPAYPPNYPPQMMPQGYQMPGAYMPPQYPPQYPPGYGQPSPYGQPMGYPQMMPMQQSYPQMMPMQPAYAPAAVAAPAVAAPVVQAAAPEEAAAPKVAEMAVRLPNPEETGAKPITPPAPAAGAAPGAKPPEKPSTTAADIIKQYMNKRT